MMKNSIDILKGISDFILNKRKKNTYGGPFNNQYYKQQTFKELLTLFKFEEIVETGTYNGNTTEYMHKVSLLKTRTVENNPRKYGFAWSRLFRYYKIRTYFGESSKILDRLCSGNKFRNRCVFFYLDAHFNGPIPLLREIEIILTNLKQAVIMIDDFRVPGFPAYLFDTYATGESLDLKYLEGLNYSNLNFFFPTVDPKNETGFKRGYVVLTANPDMIVKLKLAKLLRIYQSDRSSC